MFIYKINSPILPLFHFFKIIRKQCTGKSQNPLSKIFLKNIMDMSSSMKVYTGDLDRDWHDFEVANLRWLNVIISSDNKSAWKLFRYAGKFFRYLVLERRPLHALKRS